MGTAIDETIYGGGFKLDSDGRGVIEGGRLGLVSGLKNLSQNVVLLAVKAARRQFGKNLTPNNIRIFNDLLVIELQQDPRIIGGQIVSFSKDRFGHILRVKVELRVILEDTPENAVTVTEEVPVL